VPASVYWTDADLNGKASDPSNWINTTTGTHVLPTSSDTIILDPTASRKDSQGNNWQGSNDSITFDTGLQNKSMIVTG
jgi:hypothetical protein